MPRGAGLSRLLRPRHRCCRGEEEQPCQEITRRQAIATWEPRPRSRRVSGVRCSPTTTATKAGIDAALAAAVKAGRVPGVVALATSDKDTIYSGAFGVRSIASPQPMTLDSVFWIASMTKAVTTTAAMQMVEQGKLKLDAPASEHPAGARHRRKCSKGSMRRGHPSSVPPSGPITLRLLLTHTAGYSYDCGMPITAATRKSPICRASSPARTMR